MKRLILEILENNSRISVEDLAAMLGKNTGGYYGSHGGDGRRKYHLWLQYTY